jgi:aminopeptidase N
MVALMLTLPSEKYLGELSTKIDVDAIHHARNCVSRKISKKLKSSFLAAYERCNDNDEFSTDSSSVARRSLKNVSLHYLAIEGSDASLTLLENQFYSAKNMSDELSAFRGLVHSGKSGFAEAKSKAKSHFYDKWKHENLVMNHWFSVQATQPLPSALNDVKGLMKHEAFDFKNPNKLRSLVGAFCTANINGFHAISGAGYDFLTEQLIRLNETNPQIASRLVTPFTKWRKFDDTRMALMKGCLEKIQSTENLSKDVFEVVNKTLEVK